MKLGGEATMQGFCPWQAFILSWSTIMPRPETNRGTSAKHSQTPKPDNSPRTTQRQRNRRGETNLRRTWFSCSWIYSSMASFRKIERFAWFICRTDVHPKSKKFVLMRCEQRKPRGISYQALHLQRPVHVRNPTSLAFCQGHFRDITGVLRKLNISDDAFSGQPHL